MSGTDARPVVSAESFRCRTVIPSARCLSSRDVGWRSILVDHHLGSVSRDPYEALATFDQEIGVATSGRYASESFWGGRWRRGTYEAGAVCILRPGEARTVRFEAFDRVDSSTAMIYLPKGQMSLAAEHLRRTGHAWEIPELAFIDRDPAIAQMTASLIGAMTRGADNLYAETAAAWLSVHLLTHHAASGRSDESRRDEIIADSRLARVVELIMVGFGQPLSLERLAAEACISKFHFARVFRNRIGVSPHAFLTNVRLEGALQMLGATDLPIGEVGASCGYRRPSAFSAAFRAKYGMSPETYRSSRR